MALNNNDRDVILRWCASILGPVEVVGDRTQPHAGIRATVYRLHSGGRHYYVKRFSDRFYWESECYAYSRWVPAFGDRAPRLLAARDEAPWAILLSELPGRAMADAGLALAQERDVWRAAGQALVALHDLAVGESFGPSYRDGTCAASAIREARAFVMVDLDDWTERGLMLGCLDAGDLTVINAARDLVPAFEGERPTPCHRDYGPANWLVTADGAWAGVIDFEFARWDVRVADLTRYPDWEWMRRPDLVEAFLEGYGRSFSPAEEQQRLVGHVQYALSAIVWGRENSYHGFEAEGREALAHLAGLLD